MYFSYYLHWLDYLKTYMMVELHGTKHWTYAWSEINLAVNRSQAMTIIYILQLRNREIKLDYGYA